MKKLLILLMALLVVTACKKDDDDDDNTPQQPTFEEQLVGQYAFTSATFNQEVKIYNVMAAGDSVVFPAGSDATMIVGGSLLDDSPCDNSDNTLMDMRADYSLFYICAGESNEEQMGTWTANEAESSVALNVNSELGPIAITITQVVLAETSMTGNINGLPIPMDLSQPVGAGNVQFISVGVVFTIVE